jgi:hypothetical protein
MITAGFDTPKLRKLAGSEKPYNHFEIAALRDVALDELGQQPVSRDVAVRRYARERLQAALDDTAVLPTEFEVVAHLFMQTDLRDLYDFYLLHFAHEDLKTLEVQWYWPDADRTNILEIMKLQAQAFVARETQGRSSADE